MNGVILINKPKGYTSHDIVNIARKVLHTKKVGHAGTLDPDATGVLVLCVNKATKVLQFLTSDSKEYIATLSLGKATDSYDASGNVIEEKEVGNISLDEVKDVLNSFIGKQQQIPPMYSAIKVNGRKLYEYARNNETVEVKPRDIEINKIDLLKFENNEITFKVACSKGTYIRSLCVDIARKLGYPGHMLDLIRTRSGNFKIEDCCSLEDFKEGKFSVRSIEEALDDYVKVVIDDENIVYHGKKITSDINEMAVIVNREGKVLAMYGPDGKGQLKNIRGLW